jgi:hypothetical protein
MPAGANGIEIASGPWGTALTIDPAATSAGQAIQIYPQCAIGSGACNSQYINFTGQNGSNVFQQTTVMADSFGNLRLTPVVGGLVQMYTGRAMVAGPQPTCTFTSGGGASPTCILDTGSTDSAGIIIAQTGTGSPAGTGTITLTFTATQTFGTNKPVCEYQASDNNGTWQGLAVFKDKTPSNTSDLFTWTNGPTPTALTVSTNYWINYQCWAK